MKRKGKIFIALLAVALLVCIAAVSLAACDGDKNNGVTSNGGNSGTPSGDISGGIWDIIPRGDVENCINFINATSEYDRYMKISFANFDGYPLENYFVYLIYRMINLYETKRNDSSVEINRLCIYYLESEEEAKEYVDNHDLNDDYYNYDYVFYEDNKVFLGSGDKDFYKNAVLAVSNEASQMATALQKHINIAFEKSEESAQIAWNFSKHNGDILSQIFFVKGNSRLDEEMIYYSITNLSENQAKWETLSKQAETIRSGIGTEYTEDSYVTIDKEKGEIYYKYTSKSGFRFEDIKNKNDVPTGEAEVSDFYYDNASNLSVVIPSVTPKGKPVTKIGDYAFSWATDITKIFMPTGVTSIGIFAFDTCLSLKLIVIPDSVTSIDRYAFDDCKGLQTVYYEGTSEQWKEISIDNNGNSCLINAKRYYFSADDPYKKGTAKEGEEYWHWNEDKTKPVVWAKQD